VEMCLPPRGYLGYTSDVHLGRREQGEPLVVLVVVPVEEGLELSAFKSYELRCASSTDGS
jgi:hypothetical protein